MDILYQTHRDRQKSDVKTVKLHLTHPLKHVKTRGKNKNYVKRFNCSPRPLIIATFSSIILSKRRKKTHGIKFQIEHNCISDIFIFLKEYFIATNTFFHWNQNSFSIRLFRALWLALNFAYRSNPPSPMLIKNLQWEKLFMLHARRNWTS